MSRHERRIGRGAVPAALVLLVGLASMTAHAATYYVDVACANNGNGLSDTCATSSGGAGRFNDLRQCDTRMVAGDTCLIRPGNYHRAGFIPTGRRDLEVAYHPVNSGTASAPITYKAFDPANPPKICSAPGCSTTTCDFIHSAIGTMGQSYIVFDGLRIIGNMTLWGSPQTTTNVTVRNVEISGGWTWQNSCYGGVDGNWTGLRIEYARNLTVENVYIHDVNRAAPDRGNGMKLYDVDDSLFQYLTIYNTLYSGFELKASCTNNELRYSRLINVGQLTGESVVRGANQTPPNGGNRIHHNVMVCGTSDSESAAYYIPTAMITGTEQFHHNTVYNCGNGHKMNEGADTTTADIHDNIIQTASANSAWSTVVALYTPQCTGCDYSGLDYNAYRYPRWRWNTTADPSRNFTDLASWRSFWSGKGRSFESHSAVVDCQLTSPGTTLAADFHPQNSACKTMSSTGSFVGAHGTDSDCLGYGCSGSTPPPSSNNPPNGTIDAPATDVTIQVGGSVTFAGSASDPENNTPFTYRWNFGAGSGIADSTVEDPGARTFNTTGVYTVTFTVTDSTGNVDPTPATRRVTVQSGPVSNPIAKSAWHVTYVDSQETSAENGAGTNAIDSATGTIWHTQWQAAQPPCPHEIRVDLGTSYDVDGFRYLPRQDGGTNGRIGQYEFYVSADGTNWGTVVASGTFADDATEKSVSFTKRTGRYVRLRALSATNGGPYTAMAELNVTGAASTGNSAPANVTNERRTDVR